MHPKVLGEISRMNNSAKLLPTRYLQAGRGRPRDTQITLHRHKFYKRGSQKGCGRRAPSKEGEGEAGETLNGD